MSGTETRSFPGLLEVRAGGDGRTVTGLVAPFHTPTPIGSRFIETFEPGSFRLDREVRLHSGHPRDDRDMPVSPPGRLWEQRDGVAGEWHLSRTTAADDLLALIGDKAVRGLSVGFLPDEDADRWSDDGRLVTRRGALLVHVAAVEEPAYTGAQVTSVRAVLSAGDRQDLADDDFAYIGPDGDRHLPIHDKAHVANALARLNQTDIPPDAKRKAFAKIAAKAAKLGVEVSDEMKARYRSVSGQEAVVQVRAMFEGYQLAEDQAAGCGALGGREALAWLAARTGSGPPVSSDLLLRGPAWRSQRSRPPAPAPGDGYADWLARQQHGLVRPAQ